MLAFHKIYLLLIIFLISSCPQDSQTVVVNDKYSFQKISLSKKQKELIHEKSNGFPNQTQLSIGLIKNGKVDLYGIKQENDSISETKSFNVWPVYDPENIDKRRAEIGLGPIAEHLKNRFDFEWNLEEQIRRTKEFAIERNK